jgi:hypothetical protein
VGAVQLVGAHGEHQQHRPVDRAGDEQREQVQRRLVRPLHVFEDQHQRSLGGQAADDRDDELEQP